MELIYAKDNFSIFADTREMCASIVRGANKIMLELEPLVPLSPLEAKNLRLLGQNPADYLHIGHSCHIIPREAASAWDEVLTKAIQMQRSLDTSMIQQFRTNLPGLSDVREIEDLGDALTSGISLYVDTNDAIPALRATETRRRFPRETLYVHAERQAMSPNERQSAAARRILAALIGGKELPAHDLALLDQGTVPGRPRPTRATMSQS